jgi:hypothetical protein
VSLLGEPNVWVALTFTSDDSNNLPNGAFVDDVMVRKCDQASCPGLMAAGPAPAAPEAVDTPVYMRLQR